jgi:hypothetical protein
MPKVDVEKMRRYAARQREVTERRNRQAWLKSLDPEHRAVHEQGLPGLCTRCLNANLAQIDEKMRAGFRALSGR